MPDRQSSDSSQGSPSNSSRQSLRDRDAEGVLLQDPLPEKALEEPLLPLSERSVEAPIHSPRRLGRRRVCLLLISLVFVAAIGIAIAVSLLLRPSRAKDQHSWNVEKFRSIITFGDSFTDERRFWYFKKHNNTGPPPGTLLEESLSTNSGGRTWARYVVQYTGSSNNGQWQPQMTLYNYAVAGSVCSNKITPRKLDDGTDYPSVLEYEVPAFAADQAATRVNSNSSEPYFQPALTPSNAVFVMWIGTNDLGAWSFLTGDQVRGKTISDYTDCVYAAWDGLYAAGARTFVLMNTIPLHLAPWYANETLHGEGNGDLKARAEKMHEFTTSANSVFRYQTPFEFKVSNRYPGAHVALFDVWSLIRDIYFHPEDYLNGTAPLNVTGYATNSDGSSPDSFLWRDGLHPSEQTDRIIASNMVQVLNGSSRYAQYW